ncbi:ATP-binding protein [Micromonospora sp. WMMD987]|uniref:ATP-binding protein n=1 Tax=Micromonospora sp. WMMD987 TaxID=3016089 RepID=UPI00249B07AB|nr:ATP-binding protein [Micromonospora sp. WMMD987]WFE93022.1 ATP-binding protein [Micromonospora sp. WMMD987]
MPAPRPAARWPGPPPATGHDDGLAAEVDRIQLLLKGEPAPAPGADGSTLGRIATGFGLTAFERDVLVASVAGELGLLERPATFAWCLDALPGGHWDALAADRPLRAARLVGLGEGPLPHAPLRVDERILHELRGVGRLDERLAPYLVALPPPPAVLPASRRRAAQQLCAAWQTGRRPLRVCGPDHADRVDVLAAACATVGRAGHRVAAADLPRAVTDRDAFARLWNREVVLADPVLVVELTGDEPPDTSAAVAQLLARLVGDVVVCTPRAVALDGVTPGPTVDRPTRAEQRALWRELLPGRTGQAAAVLAREFDLGHREILDATAPATAAAPGPAGDPGALARGLVHERVRRDLDGLAERIDVRAGWDDLVLPAAALAQLRQLTAAAAGRTLLAEQGFAGRTGRGLGVAALFAGPSGTGKTLAAEVVAGVLGLDLHRVDLATVVSKWIGETEKQLRRIFDAAERGGTVLLFDEADALFGRRSEVRDSHDRYANIEVSYLLQRMEQYRGVAVLTTNMRTAIDPAFLRRLRVVVPFAHPGPVERAGLWRRAFPAGVATADLDLPRLAALDLTGGDIHTVALRAALVAAGEGHPVGMRHVLDAVAAEYAKHDRPADPGLWS